MNFKKIKNADDLISKTGLTPKAALELVEREIAKLS